MEKYIYIALFAPLVGSLVAALFSMQPKTLFTGVFTSFMLAVSMYASLLLLYSVYTTGLTLHVNLFDWIVIGNLNIPFGFVVDEVSVVMI
jgi:NADH-quinone oxidoreductase subunit L